MSDNEHTNEKRETITDIVAYIRKCLDVLDEDLTRRSNREKITMTAEALLCPVLNAKAALDRIEAAWKEESKAIATENAVIPAVCITKPSGNAAAMRKALDAAFRFIGNLEIEPYSPLDEDASELRQRIMDAISTPARNCDMFGGDFKMLHTAWFDWTGSPSGQNPDGTVKLTFDRWLLAPSAERKGEGE